MQKYIFIPGVHLEDIENTPELANEVMEDFVGDLEFTVVDDYDELPDLDIETVEIVLNTKCELANIFTTLEKWIKHTSLACWYCGLTFDTMPWFEAVIWTRGIINETVKTYNINLNFPDSDTRREITIIRTAGNYCGPCCVRRSIEQNCSLTPQMKRRRINMLYYIYKLFNGSPIKFIPPAIDRTKMKRYCGSHGLTETEYREMNDNLLKSQN